MAVELTGSPSYVVNRDFDDGSQAVTIPADCTAVLVFSCVSHTTTEIDFDELNWDNGATNDFTQVVHNGAGANNSVVFSYIMTSASGDWPGTGSQTLYFGFNATPGGGGPVIIVFLKGLDTSTPTVDTDSDYDLTDGDWTASLSGVSSGDLTFLMVGIYYAYTIDGRGSGQTQLASDSNDNSFEWEINYEDGEGSPSIQTNDSIYSGAVAFAVSAASGSNYQLTASIAGVTTTPAVDLGVLRAISASIAARIVTPDIDLNILRALTAVVNGVIVTSDIDLTISGLIQLTASIAGVTTTPEVDLGVTRALTAAPAGVTVTPAVDLNILRALTATIVGQTSTPDIDLGVLRAISASIAAQTATPNIGLNILRALTAAPAGAIVTSDIDLTISGLIQLTASIAAQTVTPDIALSMAREISASIQGSTVTAEAVLSVARRFSADIDAVTVTSAINLILGGLGVITDPSIESLTPERTLSSLTAERSIE